MEREYVLNLVEEEAVVEMEVCRECGCLHKVEDMEYDTVNNNYVCKECFEEQNMFYCEHCSTIHAGADLVSINDGEMEYCRECAEVYCCICEGCGNYYTAINGTLGNNNLFACDQCRDDYGYYICEYCGDLLRDDEIVFIKATEEITCERCAEDNFNRCCDCGEYFPMLDTYRTHDGEHLCGDCLENGRYAICEDCGDIIHFDQCFNVDGEWYCCDCVPDECETLHGYSYKPVPVFYGTKGTRKYLGVELEIDCGYRKDKKESVELINDNLDWAYCKTDSSLDCGIEIVTHPCSLEYHMEKKDVYKKTFSQLVDNKWRSHDTTTCGLHVHVSRDCLGDSTSDKELTVAKIMLIIDNLWDKGLVTFTRRKESELNRWAKRYCLAKDDVVESSKQCKGMGRYFALNLTNTNTIEFRLFKGTLNIDTYMATIQLVSNIVDFAKDKSLLEIQTGITFKDVVNYVHYDELTQYANELNLI